MRSREGRMRIFDGYLINNRIALIISTFFIILGICAGSVYCSYLSSDGSLGGSIGDFSAIRENAFSREVFMTSIANSFWFAVFLWLCGTGRLGALIAPVLLMAKGFAASFCVAALVAMYGGAGFAAAAAAIFPQMLMMFVIAEVFCVAAINQALYGIKHTDKAERRRRFISYCIFCMILFCGFVLCSLYECYVSPWFMMWILGI